MLWHQAINNMITTYHHGHVVRSEGSMIIASLPGAFVGEICTIELQATSTKPCNIDAEVIAIDEQQVRLMPFRAISSVRFGDKVLGKGQLMTLPTGKALLGHVVNAFGESLDNKPIESKERSGVNFQQNINPLTRSKISARLNSRINALDSFIPLAKGQRLGILAGSGVGKSTLLTMLGESCIQDDALVVIVLVGERGREVEEFVRNNLSDELSKRSVLVSATADEMPIVRVQAVKYGLAIAEKLSETGQEVVLMVDSLTRVAMAQREIGLAIGEPPTAKGYTPSVFFLLQYIVERCGAFLTRGSITALFTILVESDDFNDPIVDSLRAVLDGHIVLDRVLAEQGHYPAIDILKSISRLQKVVMDDAELSNARKGRKLMREYQDKKMLIDLSEAEGTLSEKYQLLKGQYDSFQLWTQQEQLTEKSLVQRHSELTNLLTEFS